MMRDEDSPVFKRAFTAYQTYCALKAHFETEKYDYTKYGGQIRVSSDSFKKRADKWKFISLVKKLQNKEFLGFFLAQILKDRKLLWIGKYVQGTTAMENYHDYLKRHLALSRTFKNELDALCPSDDIGDLKDMFRANPGELPEILRRLFNDEISYETFIVLTKVTRTEEYFEKQVTESFVWPELLYIIKKYEPFIRNSIADLTPFKDVFRSKFDV